MAQAPVNPLPIVVGKTVIVKQAVLLASDLRLPAPSQSLRSSGIVQVHSPLQWRDRAGITPDFPIKPRRAPISTISFFTNHFNKYLIYTSK
ncbi:hypothetical protein SATMO3_07140 [Sporomusa aerivorans]